MKVKIWEEGKTSPVDYQPLHWASNVPGVIAQTVSEAYKKIEIGFEEGIDLLRAFYDFNSEKLHIKTYLFKPFELEPGRKRIANVVLTSANSAMDDIKI